MSCGGKSVQPTLTKGKLAAVGVAVDGGGQEVLAHARLAVEQHVGVGFGRDFDHPPHALHGGRAADDGRFDVGGREALGRARLGGLPLPLDAGQERKEVLVAEGFCEEVEGPQLDRLDGHGNAAVGGHHNDFHRRPAGRP